MGRPRALMGVPVEAQRVEALHLAPGEPTLPAQPPLGADPKTQARVIALGYARVTVVVMVGAQRLVAPSQGSVSRLSKNPRDPSRFCRASGIFPSR